ncbi:MAG: DNA polymerase IV [Berryella intestinalis]|nr:DNA polymerase IV [Berryella intestinalis]
MAGCRDNEGEGRRGHPVKPDLYPWGRARAVLLVDLDAFFASVEQLDHPAWRGKPVIVGGSPTRRGVVSTCSYEARAFGVRSAMPSSQAAALCPQAIWTEGNFHRYREVSNQIMAILLDETPYVRQVSIDEAFVDVTPGRGFDEHPVEVAARIQRRVRELGVSCSIGVATSKSIAKIASDYDKPCGLTVVYPGSERAFIEDMPVRKLSGIGAAAERKLISAGIETLGDLIDADDARIERLLGKAGRMMLDRARGVEAGSIGPDDEVKSVSSETTFGTDASGRDEILAAASSMAAKVGRRLRRKGLKGRTLTLKIRFGDRAVRSVQHRLPEPTDSEFAFDRMLQSMLDELWREGMSVRLVGVAVTGFDEQTVQQSLFDAAAFFEPHSTDDPMAAAVADDRFASAPRSAAERHPGGKRGHLQETRDARKTDELLCATDRVRDRFGDDVLLYGKEIRTRGNTTGSSSKNPADYK